MATRYNPSVHQELRYQNAPITPLIDRESHISWLKRTGRLMLREREIDKYEQDTVLEEIDEIVDPEIYHLQEEE